MSYTKYVFNIMCTNVIFRKTNGVRRQKVTKNDGKNFNKSKIINPFYNNKEMHLNMIRTKPNVIDSLYP